MKPMSADARRNAPAALRNRDPILDVLRAHLPPRGLILEIASGSGQHAIHFGASLPDHILQPSDPDAAARASIDAWILDSGLPNVRPALALDAAATHWPIATADAVLCINMIHISPWASAAGLFQGAARVLPPGALLYLYGPYKRGGAHTAPSNADFDASLQMQNPEWGVRDLEAVEALARDNGFAAPDIVAMPANNLSLMFRLEKGEAR
jgi:SAM-dependent methyltransferase